MGLPTELLLEDAGAVDEEFICPICLELLEDPLMLKACEHIFCRACIQSCRDSSPLDDCPLDRIRITGTRPPHRSFIYALNKVQIKCKFSEASCSFVGNVSNLNQHCEMCEYKDPDSARACPKDCGAEIKLAEMAVHDCIAYLKQNKEVSDKEHEQLVSDLLDEIRRKAEECKQSQEEVEQLRADVSTLVDAKMQLQNELELLKDKSIVQNQLKPTELNKEEDQDLINLSPTPQIQSADTDSSERSAIPPDFDAKLKKLGNHAAAAAGDEVSCSAPISMLTNRDMTLAELRKYDGVNPEGSGIICIAFKGKIYDVTHCTDKYGPGGQFEEHAGRDITRARAKNDFSEIRDGEDDLSDLNPMELKSVALWEARYSRRYPFVGNLLRPVGKWRVCRVQF